MASEVDAVAYSGVGVALGDRAAFSVATIDSGRLRGRSGDCDVGLLCHASGVLLVDGIPAEGDITEVRFREFNSACA